MKPPQKARTRAREALAKFASTIEAEAREAFCTIEGQATWPNDWEADDPVGYENWKQALTALGTVRPQMEAEMIAGDWRKCTSSLCHEDRKCVHGGCHSTPVMVRT